MSLLKELGNPGKAQNASIVPAGPLILIVPIGLGRLSLPRRAESLYEGRPLSIFGGIPNAFRPLFRTDGHLRPVEIS